MGATIRSKEAEYPSNGLIRISNVGQFYANPYKRATPEEWAYALAHGVLHLGFGHFQKKENSLAWEATCETVIYRFLEGLNFGEAPHNPTNIKNMNIPGGGEEELYNWFWYRNTEEDLKHLQINPGEIDFFYVEKKGRDLEEFKQKFAVGIQFAVAEAVENVHKKWHPSNANLSPQEQFAQELIRSIRQWFMDSFPLLGGIVASFEFVYDLHACRREDVAIAAVDAYAKEIFINPLANLNKQELIFVIAHEILHAALRHDMRCSGRDAYLWNVACDYVINGWLVEMNVGEMPQNLLYDPDLKGLSAEGVYDRIARDLRRLRKLETLRGKGKRDMLDEQHPNWWERGHGIDLDAFYRNALQQGLELQLTHGRGLLPAGLAEEIRALAQPPIAWDVELARWLDGFIPALELKRTYARASRRQSGSPNIPLPHYIRPETEPGRTFGVIVDTSGSMSRRMLGEALGAISSYAIARDVERVRLISCDAAAYDHGFLPPEAIGDKLTLQGRGGTVLQPGIDMLEKAKDFPKNGPILIITDGECDTFKVRREHAILLPQKKTLPFSAKGPVFRMKE